MTQTCRSHSPNWKLSYVGTKILLVAPPAIAIHIVHALMPMPQHQRAPSENPLNVWNVVDPTNSFIAAKPLQLRKRNYGPNTVQNSKSGPQRLLVPKPILHLLLLKTLPNQTLHPIHLLAQSPVHLHLHTKPILQRYNHQNLPLELSTGPPWLNVLTLNLHQLHLHALQLPNLFLPCLTG